MTKLKGLNFLCICCFLFLSSSKPSDDGVLNIVAGTAKITGKITRPNNTSKDNIYVKITVPHQITGEYVNYEAVVDQSGKFSIDVDVETTVSLIRFHTSVNTDKALLLKLKSGDVTQIDIVYNSDSDIENIKVTPDMNKNDMDRCFNLIGEMIMIQTLPGKTPEPLHKMSPDYFLNYINTILSERLAVVNNDTLISKELKEVLYNEARLFTYREAVFAYTGEMKEDHSKDKESYVQKIDRSFYHFLKDFKLNNPQHLYAFSFLEFQGKILQNEILALPKVGESDVRSWLVQVKAILSDLLGFNDGPYYDILAANAYGRQLTEELRPFSERQKENIRNYWKDGEIAKILLRKNQQIVELDKSKWPVVVNDISSIADDKVMETIAAKHKGKVVLIDLWATWCVPCLNAMKEFRSTKNEFHDKDVVFVYLTNGSSPKELWEEKIKGIGSEHYYLKDTQWKYMMEHFAFKGIPSYILYNKDGALINKFTGFPGNDKVKKMINDLL
ncbi:TlpA disulfide reductase family protein [Pedobacter frigoris]|uniref:TlpA family protein disulfide reductase n=1 Tax=Pedobacter frigoris TaxID=2571272 RepID=UPI00292E7A52|nr:TlpA disulfide reductase family protein [Pedobacter frigoris]